MPRKSTPTRSGWPSWSRCRSLDEVAYLRFASVYQAFESLEDFESAISLLRHEAETKGRDGKSPDKRPLQAPS